MVRRRVLLVGGDPVLRRDALECFQPVEAYEVETIFYCDDALAMLLHRPFDLVLVLSLRAPWRTWNQNQIKRPMQEHRQSIVTIKDCFDLVSFDGLKAFQGIPAQNGVATTSRTRRLTITIVRLPAGVYRARGGVPHPGGVSGAGSARYPFRLSHAWTALRKPYHPLPL